MQRFFFDVDDGQFHEDTEGTSLRDEEAALEEAVKALAEMARDLIPTSSPPSSITMWVRDEAGKRLMELAVSLSITRWP
ncbi:MAG: hypothetical protein JWR39_2632 [Devosia sp.]|jgi:hypothetical protein|nr:hypothetical protein [Devosia sp.]